MIHVTTFLGPCTEVLLHFHPRLHFKYVNVIKKRIPSAFEESFKVVANSVEFVPLECCSQSAHHYFFCATLSHLRSLPTHTNSIVSWRRSLARGSIVTYKL
jgi:hypothetical protein